MTRTLGVGLAIAVAAIAVLVVIPLLETEPPPPREEPRSTAPTPTPEEPARSPEARGARVVGRVLTFDGSPAPDRTVVAAQGGRRRISSPTSSTPSPPR